MFTQIHGNYDLMNKILSMGIDKQWRIAAAKQAMIHKQHYKLLDIASGTGELAIQIAKHAKINRKHISIFSADYNSHMQRVAKRKISEMHIDNVRFSIDDALNLSYKSNSFDVVTCSFAMRDFDDLGKFISEVRRVLKTGGKFVLMDMAMPDTTKGRLFFSFYSRIMHIIGSFENQRVYDWLIESIKKFDKRALLSIIRANRFEQIKIVSLATGVAFIITGIK